MEETIPARTATTTTTTAVNDSRRLTKWLATAASIWIQCTAGGSYAFGIYSPLLKSTQGYNQKTLNAISVSKDFGANAGILSGLLYSAVSPLAGPWVVHLVGVIQCFFGYFFMWLSVTGKIHKPRVAVMCVFMYFAAHAQTFLSTANVVTAVQNFPGNSGTIVGIMKGFIGLSGAILIQVYFSLSIGSPSKFLLMLAFLPTLLTLLLMFLIRIKPDNSTYDKKILNRLSLFSLIIAAYIMILIILENRGQLQKSWFRIPILLILLTLLSSPFSIPIGFLPIFSSPSNDVSEQKRFSTENVTKFGEDKNLLQATKTVNFWLIFVAMLCGMGSGLATINNISQIGESLGYKSVQRNTLVSLWSIWNFLGRFGAGFVSDYFLHKKSLGRPMFMAITLASMSIGHLIIASGFRGNLFVGSVLVGISYGSQWSLMPTISCELFGVLHMGTIFNTIAVASPVGSYILSVWVIGYNYDKNSHNNVCKGRDCFKVSFFILACVTLFGFFAAMGLFVRTRKIYTKIAEINRSMN